MKRFSHADQLYIDFDMPRAHDVKGHRYYRPSPRVRPIFTVLRLLGLRVRTDAGLLMERTAHGWHVIISLAEKLQPAEIVAAQLALGDDQRRGALNLMRALAIRKLGDRVTAHWGRRWNILFAGKLK